MFGSKSRKIAELKARVEQFQELLDEAYEDTKAHKHARRVAERQLAEADAANTRLDGRIRHVTELLELAREAQSDSNIEQLTNRLERALRACARYRAEAAAFARALANSRTPTQRQLTEENSKLHRRLGLAEEARRSLDEQLARVQADNDALCREAVDRAGTLAKIEVPT